MHLNILAFFASVMIKIGANFLFCLSSRCTEVDLIPLAQR